MPAFSPSPPMESMRIETPRQPLPDAPAVSDRLDRLRRRILALEQRHMPPGQDAVFDFGAPDLDRALPWNGLPAGRLHQFANADPDDPTASAPLRLALGLIARRLKRDAGSRPVLWIRCGAHTALPNLSPYPAGLDGLGLPPARTVFATPPREKTATEDALWIFEEALRCGGFLAVLAEIDRVGMTAGRRLQLAAEQSGTIAFLIEHQPTATSLCAATTRFSVRAAPTPALPAMQASPPRFRLRLERCRNAMPREDMLEWTHETHSFHLVTLSADGPSAPRAYT